MHMTLVTTPPQYSTTYSTLSSLYTCTIHSWRSNTRFLRSHRVLTPYCSKWRTRGLSQQHRWSQGWRKADIFYDRERYHETHRRKVRSWKEQRCHRGGVYTCNHCNHNSSWKPLWWPYQNTWLTHNLTNVIQYPTSFLLIDFENEYAEKDKDNIFEFQFEVTSVDLRWCSYRLSSCLIMYY